MVEGQGSRPLRKEDIRFSVVIPFRNAAYYLGSCLEAIATQTHANAEFILVDNNSEDAGPELVCRFVDNYPVIALKFLREKKKGASAARNSGVRAASGLWVVFTDSDCIPTPEWLEDLAMAIVQYPQVGAFAGCIRSALPRNRIEKFSALFTLPANQEEKEYRQYTLVSGGFPTANFAVNRNLFETVGGFDEEILIYGEDHALCAQIYKQGYTIRALNGALIYHQHRADLRGFCRQAFGFGRSHALCLRKSVPGALILEAPLLSVTHIAAGWRIWIDLKQADKKMLLAMGASFFCVPLLILPFFYFLYLCWVIYRRGERMGLGMGRKEAPLLALLLILKAAAMTAGRVAGSWRYRVICL